MTSNFLKTVLDKFFVVWAAYNDYRKITRCRYSRDKDTNFISMSI